MTTKMGLQEWKALSKIFMRDEKPYLVTMKKNIRTSTKTNALCQRKDSLNKIKVTSGAKP
jgi:hypothetical protein